MEDGLSARQLRCIAGGETVCKHPIVIISCSPAYFIVGQEDHSRGTDGSQKQQEKGKTAEIADSQPGLRVDGETPGIFFLQASVTPFPEEVKQGACQNTNHAADQVIGTVNEKLNTATQMGTIQRTHRKP